MKKFEIPAIPAAVVHWKLDGSGRAKLLNSGGGDYSDHVPVAVRFVISDDKD